MRIHKVDESSGECADFLVGEKSSVFFQQSIERTDCEIGANFALVSDGGLKPRKIQCDANACDDAGQSEELPKRLCVS